MYAVMGLPPHSIGSQGLHVSVVSMPRRRTPRELDASPDLHGVAVA